MAVISSVGEGVAQTNVKRMATTKASKTEADFERCKEQFLFDVESIIQIESIPEELVINWDQTGINLLRPCFELDSGS